MKPLPLSDTRCRRCDDSGLEPRPGKPWGEVCTCPAGARVLEQLDQSARGRK